MEYQSGDELKPLDKQNDALQAIQQALPQAENKTIKAEALLLTVNTVISELNQPLTVILGLSELLLAQIDRTDPIATDLVIISKQVNRMSEIIKGVNRLNDEKPVSRIALKAKTRKAQQ